MSTINPQVAPQLCTSFDDAVAILDEEAMFMTSEEYWHQYNILCEMFHIEEI